jgi:hypothetical protein
MTKMDDIFDRRVVNIGKKLDRYAMPGETFDLDTLFASLDMM